MILDSVSAWSGFCSRALASLLLSEPSLSRAEPEATTVRPNRSRRAREQSFVSNSDPLVGVSPIEVVRVSGAKQTLRKIPSNLRPLGWERRRARNWGGRKEITFPPTQSGQRLIFRLRSDDELSRGRTGLARGGSVRSDGTTGPSRKLSVH